MKDTIEGNGTDGSELETLGRQTDTWPLRGLYVHGQVERCESVQTRLSRRYLNLGDDGRAFRFLDHGRFEEIPFEEALAWVVEPLAAMGETLGTPYDEDYRTRRSAALCTAGWNELRVQIEPENVAIH